MMFREFDMPAAVPIVLNEMKDAWCCYQLFAEGNYEPIFIGICKFSKVLQLDDVRTNSAFAEIMPGWLGRVSVMIMSTGDRADVSKHQGRLISALPRWPRCNQAVQLAGRKRRIEDNYGRIFNSQDEAARAIGCHQSQISQQLAGKLRQVRGYVFRYVDMPLPPLPPPPPMPSSGGGDDA